MRRRKFFAAIDVYKKKFFTVAIQPAGSVAMSMKTGAA
ncbi:hypothetical protein SAMN05216386_1304 [Nitrosospira briensis]|uniref:Uncharacterized protein n=1 Tax=Nitrosospira briensis TaxID=35799 RepID=A0A1I5ACB3_9PROT|nr:hypothetical protein SAMN05216386_1304 [Nitrosospira briensis]